MKLKNRRGISSETITCMGLLSEIKNQDTKAGHRSVFYAQDNRIK